MKPEKLRKLLLEIDNRLVRAEKPIVRLDGNSGPASHVLEQVSSLRAELRRHVSKVDAFRTSDVENIERRIAGLRETAAGRLNAFGHDTPISGYLQAISEDNIHLMNLCAGLRIGLSLLGPEEIIEAIPGQKTAAFQFGFEDDLLVVVDQPLRPNERESDLAMAALEAAIESGEHVNEDLSGTNASPRLKEAFGRLQKILRGYKNIVQIGANAQICTRIIHMESEELSPTLFGLLLGHLEAIFSALAQFEDWRVYSENAASLSLDANAVAALAESTSDLATLLRRGGYTQGAVPEALETVAGWVNGDLVADKRDVLSLARSHENIWSAVLKSVLALGQEVISEAKKLAAKRILVILLSVSERVVPIIAKLPGGEWIQVATDYIKSVASE